MKLPPIDAKPSSVLRALTAARLLMASHRAELTEALDELIGAVSRYIDASEDEEEREVRESAVNAARMVAGILLRHGGDAARAALGVRPPDPLEQQRLRSTMLFDPEGIASGLNSVILEIDDDAAHGAAGRHYWVAANIFLPVNLDEQDARFREADLARAAKGTDGTLL